jgi:ABC-type uncharacterized transport system permease subunit
MRPIKTLVTLSLVSIIAVAFAALALKQRGTIPAHVALSSSTESAVVNNIQCSLLTFTTPKLITAVISSRLMFQRQRCRKSRPSARQRHPHRDL